MALAVGVVRLRHEFRQLAAVSDVLPECRQAVHQADLVFRRELPDLRRVLVEWVGGIIQPCRGVRRGRQQDHAYAGRLRPRDHRDPGGARLLEPEPAVVQAVVNQHDVRPVGEHVPFEARRPRRGVFAPDCGDDHVDDRVGKAGFQLAVEQVWVRIKSVHRRRHEVARRHAVAVANDVDRAIGWPLFLQGRDDACQIPALHGRCDAYLRLGTVGHTPADREAD